VLLQRNNEAFAKLFQDFDVLVTPVMAFDGMPAKGPLPQSIDGVALQKPNSSSQFNSHFNYGGQPACAVNSGLITERGLPCGFQIVSDRFKDSTVLRLAHQYEQAFPPQEWPSPPFATQSRL